MFVRRFPSEDERNLDFRIACLPAFGDRAADFGLVSEEPLTAAVAIDDLEIRGTELFAGVPLDKEFATPARAGARPGRSRRQNC